jgi:predicted RNA-binding protein with TRAM domain
VDLPVDLGEEYEFDVVDMSPNGEGIAKIGGFLIFIAGAKRGEHVTVKITRLDSMCADAVVAT